LRGGDAIAHMVTLVFAAMVLLITVSAGGPALGALIGLARTIRLALPYDQRVGSGF
jgi:hypothetical protein